MRNRHYGTNDLKAHEGVYKLDPASINYDSSEHTFEAIIQKNIPDYENVANNRKIELPLSIDILPGGKVRFQINEIRNGSSLDNNNLVNIERYSGTPSWAFDANASIKAVGVDTSKSIWPFNKRTITFNSRDSSISIKVHLKTFKLELFYRNKLVLVVNDRFLLNIEHLRSREENASQKVPGELTFNDFEDTFQYSKEDTLPFGPESVALDFTLVGVKDVYGIPEHADSLRLKDTRDGDPYRLFNADVFEYSLDAKTPMYGAIPLMIGTTPEFSAGIFWINAADTWIDINYNNDNTETHWISESGVIDVMLFLADTPLQVTSAYTEITGRPQLPMLSSVGYHQCRWNYNDEKDVLTVDSQMDKAEIPYDFIWLDLEYTDDKKFFTWKPNAFPNPQRMLKKLKKLGRNLVGLIDPHLKVHYFASELVEEKGVSVHNHQNQSYHGHCWPGESIWIDTISVSARKVWSSLLETFLRGYENLHIWNDMNEPSIFSGPETTAPKDLLHSGGFEERSIHNLYGLTVHEATYNSMKEIYGAKNKRPFILTRAFFAGSQRTAATWTGDNVADWSYLRISIPMCLSNNVAGFPFIGADIAGFSGNPSSELLARWYQAGMWYPFFRGHAHIDTARREPYLLEDTVKSIVRDTIRLRYSLLPMFYTAFHDSSVNGTPIMTPMFYIHHDLTESYSIDDQFYLGRTGLLVKPVTQKGVTEVSMFFPKGRFYELTTLESFSIDEPKHLMIDAPIHKQPVFIEGGHIIFKKERYRRSSKLMENDPYTLIIAPDDGGSAYGKLYIDDGETFAYEQGEFMEVSATFKNGTLSIQIEHASQADSSLGYEVEKIRIAQTPNADEVTLAEIGQSETKWVKEVKKSTNGHFSVIENPLINLSEDWSITLLP